MDNWAYGGAPYRLPEKFGLADTIGRKPRCEVGVFIFGQPGFHNAARWACCIASAWAVNLLSLITKIGWSVRYFRGSSRKTACRTEIFAAQAAIAGFGKALPTSFREGQNRRIADFGTVVETCSKTAADCPCLVFPYIERTGQGLRPAVGGLFPFANMTPERGFAARWSRLFPFR